MATMLDYVNEEQATLQRILENYDFSVDSNLATMENVVILATGSSYNACLSAKITFEKMADVTITIEEPYNFNHYGRLGKDVDTIIGVSQSGKSASTIDAMKELASADINRIVLTSDLTSPITKVVDHVIDLQMGIETVGFVTKGFSTTVFQLILLGIKVGIAKGKITTEQLTRLKEELEDVVGEIEKVIEKTNHFFDIHEAELKLGSRFVAIGYGPNWGTAKEFETKFTETVRCPSQGFELEAYMHGPYLEADWTHTLFFIEVPGDNLSRSQALSNYMKDAVGKTYRITTEASNDQDTLGLDSPVSELFSQLLLVIPFQILSYKIATAKGIDLSQRIFDDFDRVLKSKI